MWFECPALLPALHVHQRAARSVIHSDPMGAITFPTFGFFRYKLEGKFTASLLGRLLY